MPGKLIKDGDCYDLEPLAKASVGRIASGLSRHIAQDIQTCGYIAWKIKTHQNIAWETENLAKDSAWEGRSPLQLLLLHPSHLAGQLVDHVQGDAEVNLGRGRSQHLKLSNIYWMRGGVPQQYGILHQCWSPAHFFAAKKLSLRNLVGVAMMGPSSITWHSSCCCEAWSTFFNSALFPWTFYIECTADKQEFDQTWTKLKSTPTPSVDPRTYLKLLVFPIQFFSQASNSLLKIRFWRIFQLDQHLHHPPAAPRCPCWSPWSPWTCWPAPPGLPGRWTSLILSPWLNDWLS